MYSFTYIHLEDVDGLEDIVAELQRIKKCLVPKNSDVKKLCWRGKYLCIWSVVYIMNLEEFHIVVIKSSEYIMTKKKSEQYIIKCKIEDVNFAYAILNTFGISKNIDIHVCM